MSSAPVLPVDSEDPDHLTREQWWAMFDEVRLSQQTEYAEHGGPVAFFRQERNGDEDRS